MSWQVSDCIDGCSFGVLCVRGHTAVVRGKETGDSGSWLLFLKMGCRVRGSRDGSGRVFQGIETWSSSDLGRNKLRGKHMPSDSFCVCCSCRQAPRDTLGGWGSFELWLIENLNEHLHLCRRR